MVGIIYLATNQINGKVYVGQTYRTLNWRIGRHYSKSKKEDYHFANALKKYNKKDWTWEVLEEINGFATKKALKFILNKYEKYYIKVLSSKNRLVGYNGTAGGDGVTDPSEEVRYQMGKSWRGKKIPKEIKKLMSESHKGIPCSDSAKSKIGAIHRGKSNWWKGRPKSAEQRKKMSVAKTGQSLPKAIKEKIRKTCKVNATCYWQGKHRYDTTKEKLSIAKLGTKDSPETKAKKSKSATLAWARRKGVVNG